MSEQKTTPDCAKGVVFCYCAEPSGEAGCKSTITGSGRLKIRGTLVDSRAAFPRCTPAALPLFCLSEARKKGAAVFCDAFIISLFCALSPYASTASYFSETFFQSSTSKNAFT